MRVHSEELLLSGGKEFEPVTFTENGTFVVPRGIRKVRIDCVGGKGQGNNGGNGGRVQCVLRVNSGLVLSVFVGKQSAAGLSAPTYNASDIRINGTEYSNRVIVAGGGGNQANSGAVGGAGGGLTGADGGNGYGGNSRGKGGTQTAGGAGGAGAPVSVGHYHNGSAGTFGLGGGGSYETNYEGPSGAGGGSSYTDPDLCSEVEHTQGYQAGNGYVTISMA